MRSQLKGVSTSETVCGYHAWIDATPGGPWCVPPRFYGVHLDLYLSQFVTIRELRQDAVFFYIRRIKHTLGPGASRSI